MTKQQKFLLVAIFTIPLFITSWGQISIGTSTPDPSAEFEIHSLNKGFLLPRLALNAANVSAPVTNPASGLLIYNTATSGVEPNNVVPGYYYWNGVKWYPIVSKSSSVGDMQYWNGNGWTRIPIGSNGSILTINEGVPGWGTKEQILVEKVWKVDRLHHVINGVYSSYTLGGANNTGVTYDNLRFTFNANGTGTHTNQFGVTYPTTWQFTTPDKRTLALTVNAPTPFTNVWEMVELAGTYLHASTNLTIAGNPNNIETFRLTQIP